MWWSTGDAKPDFLTQWMLVEMKQLLMRFITTLMAYRNDTKLLWWDRISKKTGTKLTGCSETIISGQQGMYYTCIITLQLSNNS